MVEPPRADAARKLAETNIGEADGIVAEEACKEVTDSEGGVPFLFTPA